MRALALFLALPAVLAACGNPSKTGAGAGGNDGPAVVVLDTLHSSVAVDRSDGVRADGVDAAVVTISLVGSDGKPFAGAAVTLSADGEGATLEQPSASDLSGVARGKVRSTSVGDVTVHATVVLATGSLALAQTASVTFVGGVPDAASSTFTVAPDTAPADGSTAVNLVVTVKDAQGQVLPNIAVVLAATGSGNTLTPASGSTDAHGTFTATLASTTAEDKALTATFTTVVIHASARFTVPPCHLTLSAPTTYAVGADPISLVAADFDGDGHPDLATGDGASRHVQILLNDGTGAMSVGSTYFSVDAASDASPRALVAVDLNGDGRLDLATANEQENRVGVLLGNGHGGFTFVGTFPTGAQPYAIASADFNGDSFPDLVTANLNDGTLSVLLGDGSGHFAAARTLPAGSNPTAVAALDFNGDGFVDIAAADASNADVTVRLGLGDGSFTSPNKFPTGGLGPESLVAADFDQDGRADLAVANLRSATVSVLRGKGDGTFGAPTTYASGARPEFVAAADLDGDGWQDLVSASFATGDLSVFLGDGHGALGAAQDYPGADSPYQFALADFDGDGHPDVAVASSTANTVGVLRAVCGP